ncbi:hypothetical protein Athai_55250 [Actinocatenispora thailandica]|uniref:Peptidase M16 N-terminal domain-containing protein n=1 Tax=Actinocatenispora thailandica TaxID=227318 RepID=A0A7R7DUE6_9ACTN|nr:insulinase family protein [Actinocatenispora thailandica]BCJ38022.1 hypothetical protein Athai_55250 [Actinocatenispora thailandica]
MTRDDTEVEIDGVPVLRAPAPDGVCRAGLMFRVGYADETLTQSGITHLVEHLALHGTDLADRRSNGFTSMLDTQFAVTGSEDEVVTFFDTLCGTLSDLPVDRLDTERQLLRAERRSRGGLTVGPMLRERYGAQRHGLPAYQELGLHTVDADALREWAAQWFTRQNAVLWLMGDAVPDKLRLALPDGRRMPAPPAVDLLVETPAYFHEDHDRILCTAVVPRSPAVPVFRRALERLLYRELRENGGYSYAVEVAAEPRGDGYSTVTVAADTVPDRQDAAVGQFLDVMAALRRGRVPAGDVTAALDDARRQVSHPNWAAESLPARALDLLLGQTSGTAEGVLGTTIEDLAGVAREFAGSALLSLPVRRQADWAGFAPVPSGSTHCVVGTRYASRSGTGTELVVGPTGVTACGASGRARTVEYASCAAVVVWPDGGRVLVGDDGFEIAVEPTLFDLDAAALDSLAAVPAQLLVPLPARDPREIPQPAEPAAPAPDQEPDRRGQLRPLVLLLVLALAFAALFGFAAVADQWGGGALGAAGSAAGSGVLIGLIARLKRRDRK